MERCFPIHLTSITQNSRTSYPTTINNDWFVTVMETLWPTAVDSVALSADELHLWGVRLDESRATGDELLAILSPDERQRAEQYCLDAPRRRFVIARAALRTRLGDYLDLPPRDVAISIASSGKPRLADTGDAIDLRFNLAHSADLALVAVTIGCEVGVDVERLRTVSFAERIARRYFHAAEIEAITAAPSSARDAAFLRCWTAKEAVLKALGRGIAGPLGDFCVPTDALAGEWVKLPSSRCWLQQVVPCADYIAAVACLNAQRSVRCFTFQM